MTKSQQIFPNPTIFELYNGHAAANSKTYQEFLQKQCLLDCDDAKALYENVQARLSK